MNANLIATPTKAFNLIGTPFFKNVPFTNGKGESIEKQCHVSPLCFITVFDTDDTQWRLKRAQITFFLIAKASDFQADDQEVKTIQVEKPFHIRLEHDEKDNLQTIVDKFVMENQLHWSLKHFPYFAKRLKAIPLPF